MHTRRISEFPSIFDVDKIYKQVNHNYIVGNVRYDVTSDKDNIVFSIELAGHNRETTSASLSGGKLHVRCKNGDKINTFYINEIRGFSYQSLSLKDGLMKVVYEANKPDTIEIEIE